MILKYDRKFSSIIIVKNFCEYSLEEVELVLVLVVLADVAFEKKKFFVLCVNENTSYSAMLNIPESIPPQNPFHPIPGTRSSFNIADLLVTERAPSNSRKFLGIPTNSRNFVPE